MAFDGSTCSRGWQWRIIKTVCKIRTRLSFMAMAISSTTVTRVTWATHHYDKPSNSQLWVWMALFKNTSLCWLTLVLLLRLLLEWVVIARVSGFCVMGSSFGWTQAEQCSLIFFQFFKVGIRSISWVGFRVPKGITIFWTIVSRDVSNLKCLMDFELIITTAKTCMQSTEQ